MSLKLAIQAFLKAWREPEKAKKFLEDKPEPVKGNADASHIRLLAMLQSTSRLIDFLKEDISSYTDAQVGAAARQMHGACAKTLEECVSIRPVMDQMEGQSVNIPAGYDASAIKLVGNVKGAAPYKGVLAHPGWKIHKRSLPKGENLTTDILCPAEVEIT